MNREATYFNGYTNATETCGSMEDVLVINKHPDTHVQPELQQYLMANFMLLVDGIWAMARKETTAGITMA